MPSAVKPANSISATSFGLTQVQSLPLRGAFLPPNGLSLVLRRVELFESPPALRALKPVPDLAGMNKVIAAINADHERAQVAGAAAPAADDDFMAAAAFGLHPGFGAARLVGRIRALRNDAFEVEICRRT